jgi:sporulation protein YlmC with PRC-barrel domain
MKASFYARCALVSAALFATAGGALAQERLKVQVGPGGVQIDAPGVRIGAPERPRFQAHRATKIVGMAVKNSAGESLGKVEDLVIDERGGVRYAAISFGGFLGFNEKLFAVPFSLLHFKANPDSATSHVELNVTKQVMEKAPGFSTDAWPDFGDPKFHREVDEFYLKVAAPDRPARR